MLTLCMHMDGPSKALAPEQRTLIECLASTLFGAFLYVNTDSIGSGWRVGFFTRPAPYVVTSNFRDQVPVGCSYDKMSAN